MYSSRNNKTEDQQRFCRGPAHWALSAPCGLVFIALMTFLFNVFFFLNMHSYFKDFSMAVSLQQLLACVCMFSDRLCDFSWNKLCLTLRSVLVQRLGEACVYVDPEGCAKALISLLWSCCFLYLLASAKSVHPHTCSLTLISQAHTQLSISSARLEIMKVPSPGPNILLISVELKDDASNYFDVKKFSLT